MIKRTKSFINLKIVLVFFILLFSCFSAQAAPYQYDLSIGPEDIYFSKRILIAGEQVRIYATVHNVGSEDIIGYVSFFRGIELIGSSQPISVLPGKSDDVFVDFTVPDNSFNILAKIQGTEPTDQNSANNETQSSLIYPEYDTDGDGIVDSQDDDDDNDGLADSQEYDNQCPYRLKADSDNDGVNDSNDAFPCNSNETKDTDGDGQGDNADVDDDNDGWSDSQEQARGTDPLRADTDGDGVNDPQDAYPLDPTKSQVERNIFQPPVNINENSQPAVNQVSPEVQAQEQEVKDLIESSGAAKEAEEQPAKESQEEFGEVVEKLVGVKQSFFRLDNWLMWLLLSIIIIVIAIALVVLKSFKARGLQAQSPAQPELKSVAETKEPVKPAPRVAPRPPVRPSSHVIDLKKLKK